MECKLISRYSPLLVLFLASLVNAQTGRRSRDVNNLYQVIYYGDSQVEVGDPFSISCIISIADPVEWHKDGEPIRRHSQIRHGKDEHSYIESEIGIAAARNKIEASISVQRALPKHQGRYQCNSLYQNYHMLYVVHRNDTAIRNTVSGASGSGASGSGASGGSRERTSGQRASDSALLLTSIKPTQITSITKSHHQLTTPGTLVSLDVHSISLDSEKQQHSQHHHHQQQSHHHHSSNDKSAKADDIQKVPRAFKADAVRFMNKNQDTSATKDIRYDEGSQLLGGQLNKGMKEDEYPDTTRGGSDNEDSADSKHNTGKAIVILDEDEYPASGVTIPLNPSADEESITNDDNVQGAGDDDDDDVVEDVDSAPDEEASIVIESKDVSIEDSIDKLIMNKSEINGVIRVDSAEDLLHHHSNRKLERIRNEQTLIAAPVIPTMASSTTALMILPTTTTATTSTTTTTTSTTTAATTTTIKQNVVESSHGRGSEGHHHHHHRGEHEQQQQHATVAVSDILQPNYDDPSSSLKIFDITKALTLGCNITKEGDYELSWSKDGENVSEIESLQNRHKIIKDERKFIISRALDSDSGSYTCSVRALNASRTFNVVANVIVKFESTEIGKTNMVEGEKLSLHCLAFGTNPKITWTIGNTTFSTSTDRVLLEEDDKGVENARLTIESITLNDYNDYTCEARNNATDITGKPAHVTMTVRIRGKYAALYVFVGIIVEVVVLCVIILICERRRNKTEVEESDSDQSPDQQKNGHNGNSSELRQRKT